MINVENIQKLIDRHGITWAKLAHNVGVTPQAMTHLKKTKKISIETLGRIADYFKVDVKSLLEANRDDTTINNETMLPDENFYKSIIKTYQEKVEMLEEQLAHYRTESAKKKNVS